MGSTDHVDEIAITTVDIQKPQCSFENAKVKKLKYSFKPMFLCPSLLNSTPIPLVTTKLLNCTVT